MNHFFLYNVIYFPKKNQVQSALYNFQAKIFPFLLFLLLLLLLLSNEARTVCRTLRGCGWGWGWGWGGTIKDTQLHYNDENKQHNHNTSEETKQASNTNNDYRVYA